MNPVPTEHWEQVQLFRWASCRPELALMHAIRPCAFDSVSRLTLADDTMTEYDPEEMQDEEGQDE